MKNEGSSRQRETLSLLVVTAMLVYALAHFTAAQLRLAQTEALTASLEAEYTALEAEHAALRERLTEGESREALSERARKELGLVMPGEIIFYFTGGEQEN